MFLEEGAGKFLFLLGLSFVVAPANVLSLDVPAALYRMPPAEADCQLREASPSHYICSQRFLVEHSLGALCCGVCVARSGCGLNMIRVSFASVASSELLFAQTAPSADDRSLPR
jgi:hypothetical protein